MARRRAARVDENQEHIVFVLRSAGVRVMVTSHIGGGFPDLMCWHYRVGVVLMELKMPKKRTNLTEPQKKLMTEFPIVVVTTPEEALAAMGIQRG